MEVDQIPVVLDDLDAPVVLRIRHEPAEASARLLGSLGVGYEIDPDAPRCVRPCGRPECRRTAAELRQIAELVDAETRRQNLPGIRERVDRGIEHGVRVVREPLVRYERKPVSAEPSLEAPAAAGENGSGPRPRSTCRTEGCENDRNTRYLRGPLSGLCEEKCMPARRVELSESSRKMHAGRALRTRPARHIHPEPLREPVPDPTPEPEPEQEAEATLTELAADLERAERFVDEAQEVYEDAVARFLDHPLVRRLAVGYVSDPTP